jgi:uncharacterized protein (TIGR03790 family)
MMLRRALTNLLAAVALLMATGPTWALSPDQIALVVNRAVPKGMELAQFYAQARNIPRDQIITLDLPTIEDVSFDRYERDVTPVVRRFLREHHLEQKITCLVTFYGVPLRVQDRVNAPIEGIEAAQLRQLAPQVNRRLAQIVEQLEHDAGSLVPGFTPISTDVSLDGLTRRADAAFKAMTTAAETAQEPARRQIVARLKAAQSTFMAPVDIDDGWDAVRKATTGPATAPSAAMVQELLDKPYDRSARLQLRDALRQFGGWFTYARVLEAHIDYLTTPSTGAAFDSELALVWWPTYKRGMWQPNTLNPHFREMRSAPVLMVMRLDAPTPEMVRDLIINSLAAEHAGLSGKLVVDARGLSPKNPDPKDDAFGIFDERLRTLAKFVSDKTNVPVQLDDKPEVLLPGAASDVALYCGWYSLRNYVPGMKFSRGAVGYHVASFELMTLHEEHEHGWVRGLLYGGVVGTLGAVNEPYLHAFPPPEEFFPLLMTGKVTLAEAYWATNPLTSWMISFIGDPLYNPYSKDPKVKIDDLPPLFRALFKPAAE